ncbi:MAG: SEL1-like repeat protein [Candidatus Paracaedibacteraceae bacterium]|nr:SEL1-like repeat protein [Candidatus Paracaedibacteraceae bacterium]
MKSLSALLLKPYITSLALFTALASLPTAFASEEEEPRERRYSLGNDWDHGSEIPPFFSTISLHVPLRQSPSPVTEGTSQAEESHVEYLSTLAFSPREEETLEALRRPLYPQAEATLLTAELEEEEATLPSESLGRDQLFSSMDEDPNVPLTDAQVTQFRHDLDRLVGIFDAADIIPDADELATRFLSPEQLYQRLANNQHGHVLNLSNTSFSTPSNGRIFQGISVTRSVYVVNLTNCRFTPQTFEILCEALRNSRSVQRLTLSQAALPQGALELLGETIRFNPRLQELLLPLEASFMPAEIESFYNHLCFNTTLALVRWPNTALRKVEDLARRKPIAMIHMGFFYTTTTMELNEQQRERRAVRYFEEADQHHNPLGAYGLAMIHEKNRNYEEALRYYERAAEGDNIRAQMVLSNYYRAVWPQRPSLLKDADYLLSFRWARQAAQLGYPEAIYRLGRMYEAGRHVEKSLTKAGRYFYDALQGGHPDAFSALGMLYSNPDYEFHDPEKAALHLRLAGRYRQIFSTAERLLRLVGNQQG